MDGRSIRGTVRGEQPQGGILDCPSHFANCETEITLLSWVIHVEPADGSFIGIWDGLLHACIRDGSKYEPSLGLDG
jgi:hypothetical protein